MPYSLYYAYVLVELHKICISKPEKYTSIVKNTPYKQSSTSKFFAFTHEDAVNKVKIYAKLHCNNKYEWHD